MDAVVLQLLLFSVCFSYADASCVEYYRTSTETCDGWFGWWGCKTVVLVSNEMNPTVNQVEKRIKNEKKLLIFIGYSQSSRCCSGWRSSSTSWLSFFRCNLPLCNRGYGSDTCNRINEGEVKYKDGRVVRNSGGTCYAPSRCRNCHEGYFPVTYSNGYCKACFKPPNCNMAVCSNWDDYRCDYCVEEYIRTKPGYNVYTGKPNNRQCQKACSWKHGARCFPGTCTGDMVLSKDCQCAVGFGGTNCATATSAKKPTIKDFFLTLVDSSNHKFIVDKALNKTKFWTKETVWAELKLKASSHYKLEMDNAKKPNYITHYLIGIQDMDIGLTLLRGTEEAEMSMDGGCTNFAENCDKEIPQQDLKSITSWQRIFKGNFMHGDRIKYTVSAKNGGKVFYEDRSNFHGSYSEKQYFLNGIKTTEFLELEFDIYPPVHCFEQSDDCKKDALTATDFLTQPKLTVQWDGWSDSNSGIEEYVFDIYQLKKTTDTGPLTNGKMLSPRNASYSYSSLTLDLEEPGPYSIEIVTYDRARNHKVARRIVLFDNASVVDLHGSQSRVIQATANNWINKFSDVIEIVWPGRFINIRHSNGKWLNEVEESKDVSRDLDDRHGRSERTIEKIDNIDGNKDRFINVAFGCFAVILFFL